MAAMTADLVDDLRRCLEAVNELHASVVACQIHPEAAEGWAEAVRGHVCPTLTADEAWNVLWRWWGSHERAHVLAEWVSDDLVEVEALRHPVEGGAPLLLEAWSDLKAGGANTNEWVRLFKATGYLSDGAPAPTEPVTLYRGARNLRWRRMSWTTDPDCAHGFAEWLDFNDAGLVFRALVPPRAVLGRYDGRGESEVIVNPFLLRLRHESEPPTGPRQRDPANGTPNVECVGRPDSEAVTRWRARVRASGDAALAGVRARVWRSP